MRAHRPLAAIGLVVVALAGVLALPANASGCQDALTTRVRTELAVFTDWLDRYGVDGFVGEVGWPDTDADDWNALAAAWYADATAAGVPVTTWATGEWWGTSYPLAIYEDQEAPAGVDTANTQATVLEAQATPGINVAGAEFGTPGPLDATSAFSNVNPGQPGTAYHYDGQATFDHLATRGITTVRIPFRWERIQPTLHSSLDGDELSRLQGAVGRAHAAGLEVVLDVHNYGAYWLHDGTQGVRRAIGSAEVPVSAFSDLWQRLAGAFAADPTVAFGLMNEPVSMPGGGATWERASQTAVTAIRSTGATNPILVGGYEWSGAQRWDDVHPDPWIVDAGASRYEAHHYFDRDNTGKYRHSYADELADAEARGYQATCQDEPEPATSPEPTTSTDEPAPSGRLWGADRVGTAVAVSQAGWEAADTVVVARSDHPADALAGAPLAGALDAPLLVTPRDALADAVTAEVGRLGARRAVLLGGTAALAPEVVEGLRAAGITSVVRHAGADRVATAAAISRAVSDAAATVLLVSAEAWPDALAVSGLAARRAALGDPWPVLLTGSTLPDATRTELARLGTAQVVIAGGTGVVPTSVGDELTSMGIDVQRLAGATRYATSVAAADLDLRLHGTGPLILATGQGFADGLAAGALGGRWGGTLLLVPTSAADDAQVRWVEGNPPLSLVTVGGTAAVSDETVAALEQP